MNLRMTRCLAALAITAALSAAAAADTIVAQCQGTHQGLIEGDATLQGYEGWMNGYGFGHGIVIPINVAAGQASGRRQHQPLRLYKALDKATPKLYQALVTNETLSQCYVRFFRNSHGGPVENYFTIRLQNAFISDITAASGSEGAGTREVVSFVYQKITWTDEINHTETEDDWAGSVP